MATTPLAPAKSETFTVDYYLSGQTLIIASATTPGRLCTVLDP